MKNKKLKKILLSIIIIKILLLFPFNGILYGQVCAKDDKTVEIAGPAFREILSSFITLIDTIITGEDSGTIEYNLYEFEEEELKYNNDNVVQYYQNDYSNVSYGSSNLAKCGCGPTCFSMLVSTYTGENITPKDAISWCGNSYYIKRSRNFMGLF